MKSELVVSEGTSRWVWLSNCSMDGLLMRTEILIAAVKDYDQVTEDFNEIPLTDSQHGHKISSPRKKKA